MTPPSAVLALLLSQSAFANASRPKMGIEGLHVHRRYHQETQYEFRLVNLRQDRKFTLARVLNQKKRGDQDPPSLCSVYLAKRYLPIGEEEGSFCLVELSPFPIDPDPVAEPDEDPEDEPSMFSFCLVSASRVPVCLRPFLL